MEIPKESLLSIELNSNTKKHLFQSSFPLVELMKGKIVAILKIISIFVEYREHNRTDTRVIDNMIDNVIDNMIVDTWRMFV